MVIPFDFLQIVDILHTSTDQYVIRKFQITCLLNFIYLYIWVQVEQVKNR